jgi:hypothetical protein
VIHRRLNNVLFNCNAFGYLRDANNGACVDWGPQWYIP